MERAALAEIPEDATATRTARDEADSSGFDHEQRELQPPCIGEYHCASSASSGRSIDRRRNPSAASRRIFSSRAESERSRRSIFSLWSWDLDISRPTAGRRRVPAGVSRSNRFGARNLVERAIAGTSPADARCAGATGNVEPPSRFVDLRLVAREPARAGSVGAHEAVHYAEHLHRECAPARPFRRSQADRLADS